MKNRRLRYSVSVVVIALLIGVTALGLWRARYSVWALTVHLANSADEISPQELKGLLDSGQRITLLDVREPWEWRIARLPGARLTPITHLEATIGQLDPEQPIVLYCRQGVRSMSALKRLRAAGFKHLRSLAGGIDRWATEIDPSLPRY
jgi:adenylyltransferase/sulfurtransferase